MAIATVSAFQSLLANAHRSVAYSAGVAAASLDSGTVAAHNRIRGFATPTASAACNKETAGALPLSGRWTNADVMRLLSIHARAANLRGTFLLVDVLSRSGGLDGTVTTPQTTNLPTVALPRYTDGVGVMAGLEIHTAIGSTATTVQVSYTNTVPTAGRTSPDVVIGGAAWNEQDRLVLLPLVAGDLGFRSVESVTLAASTVSAAGNFGVTLFKPLAMFAVDGLQQGYIEQGVRLHPVGGSWQVPAIHEDACLGLIQFGQGQVTPLQVELLMAKE